jgi:sulfate transport system substrate-binding protein
MRARWTFTIRWWSWYGRVLAAAIALAIAACTGSNARRGPVTLVLAAYTAPEQAYEQAVLPAFRRYWKEKTGQDVVFETSYRASEAQVCAVLSGFEPDVVALSHEGDMDNLVRLGLVDDDWRSRPHRGVVTTSIVVLAVRPGNPHGVRNWGDLARPGLQILTPDPTTSGGGRWNVSALYGAALRGAAGTRRGDPAAAQGFLRDVFRNVTVMDVGAHASIARFEGGTGDVALTYESEAFSGREGGNAFDVVIPRSTIRIENPVAVVDRFAEKHGVKTVADAFVDFLWTTEAQRAFARHGFRPVDEEVAHELASRFPPVEDLWRIRVLGGWESVNEDIFGPRGRFTLALRDLRGAR